MTETANAQGGKSGGFHYAYLIVLSCIMITCLPCALALSCAGIFFTPVSEYLGVARAQFTLYFSILNIAMMLTLPVAGRLMGKSDLRVVLSAGVALTGAGLLLMGRCSALWQFYLCGAVMGVGVAPLIYLAVPTLINAWCVKRVGFFVGLCMAFTGIGGVIFNPVGTALIQSGGEGWRLAYTVFGIITLVGTLPFTLFVVRSKPKDKGLLPLGAGEAIDASRPAAESGGVIAAKAMHMPAFWALVVFCGIITLNQTIYQFLPSYALSFSSSLPQVAAASGVVASAAMAGQAIGKVLLGIVNDRSLRAGVFVGMGCGVAGVLVMWLLPPTLALLLAGAFLFGIVYAQTVVRTRSGVCTTVCAFLFGIVYAQTVVQTPLLVRYAFGSADYPAIYSRVSMAGSLMSAVAAVFWSLVIDSAGGFPLVFVLGIVCMAICLASALFAIAHKAEA